MSLFTWVHRVLARDLEWTIQEVSPGDDDSSRKNERAQQQKALHEVERWFQSGMPYTPGDSAIHTSLFLSQYVWDLIRTFSALVFPYGLCIIVVTGLDLCTGSFMFTTVAVIQKRISIVKMFIHWFVTFFGNLAGSLFVVSIITGYGGIFDSAVYKQEAITFGWTPPFPLRVSVLRRYSYAEAIADRIAGGAYAVLSAAERVELVHRMATAAETLRES